MGLPNLIYDSQHIENCMLIEVTIVLSYIILTNINMSKLISLECYYIDIAMLDHSWVNNPVRADPKHHLV